MKTISLLLTVIVAIILERAIAEYLLVEVDGKDEKGKINLYHSLRIIGWKFPVLIPSQESKNIFQIPVHCEWSEWEIGECSKSCGGGLRINTRMMKVESKHGGEECAGSSTIAESCNLQECPGKIFCISNYNFWVAL